MSSSRNVAARRRRPSARGLVRVAVRVPAAEAARVRELARILREQTEGAEPLGYLALVAADDAPKTGYDLMKAMTLGVSLDVPDELFQRSRIWPRDYPRDVDL